MPILPLRALARHAPLVALLALGCARGSPGASSGPRPSAPPDATRPADTSASGTVVGAAAARSADAPQPDSPRLIALGDSVFHGRVAGALCAVCHGQRGRGTPKGASLHDSTWSYVDGSYASILRLLETGARTVRAHASPMLPRGGTELTPEQARAVAAYVVSLSRGSR